LSAALRAAAALLLAVACCVPQRGAAEPPQRGNAEAPLSLPRPFHVIAHRGASAGAPENTLAAFARALELGVFEVELDAQLSLDSVPVLYHDDTLDEKTALRGRVREHRVAELLRADIGEWFDRTHPGAPVRFAGTRLTALPALFAAFGPKLFYHVELKDDLEQTPERVLAAVAAAGLERRVMLTSFHRAQLERARRIAPGVPACWLLRGGSVEQLDAAAQAGFAMVGVREDALSHELVQAAHARGLAIRAFGVADSDAAMERALRTGCNGMTLDAPERLVARVLEILSAARPARAAP
jgi:glycerophosphoryl diester phosphodiesterase